MLLEGGIVDQNVDLTVLLLRARDGLAAKLGIAYVAAKQKTEPALRFDVFGRVLRIFFFAEIDDSHVGAFAREQHGYGAPDAGVAAGDQRDLALQLVAAEIGRREEARLRIEFAFGTGFVLVLRRQWIAGVAVVSRDDGRVLVVRRRAVFFRARRHLLLNAALLGGDFARVAHRAYLAGRAFHGRASSWSGTGSTCIRSAIAESPRGSIDRSEVPGD